jgi:hemerythrin-like metal-binding protein
MVDNLPDGELGPMIQDMLGQITEHFRDEEEMLAAAAYPQLQEHRQLHQQLSRRAGELSELHRRGELTVGEVFSFVAYDIAARHMLKEDRKFFDFVRRTRAADLACAA